MMYDEKVVFRLPLHLFSFKDVKLNISHKCSLFALISEYEFRIVTKQEKSRLLMESKGASQKWLNAFTHCKGEVKDL